MIERRLPHWTQAGTACFITWRTDDSLPKEVVERWRLDRFQWLRKQGINPRAADWRAKLRELDLSLQHQFFEHFSARWHDELDACHGACVLKDAANAKIVADSLLYAHEDLYELTDFVVMPNHVHLLATFHSEEAMLDQCESWKHFTARRINRRIAATGRFWQQDGFDHLVRSEEQFEHFRMYIADNPGKARLAGGEYVHWSK
ncbi:MAG: transposase [Planctomycetota bacterium]|nr:transposase [Planctomycetota bacterium]